MQCEENIIRDSFIFLQNVALTHMIWRYVCNPQSPVTYSSFCCTIHLIAHLSLRCLELKSYLEKATQETWGKPHKPNFQANRQCAALPVAHMLLLKSMWVSGWAMVCRDSVLLKVWATALQHPNAKCQVAITHSLESWRQQHIDSTIDAMLMNQRKGSFPYLDLLDLSVGISIICKPHRKFVWERGHLCLWHPAFSVFISQSELFYKSEEIEGQHLWFDFNWVSMYNLVWGV